MLVFVGAVVAGGTGAFFSDEETSTGNVLAAGAIDLGIDNESYYNGLFNEGTSWSLDFDLDDSTTTPRLFFNFDDLKPGDYGEDTISIHVTNNEAWLCADVTVTEDDDNTCNEPELDEEGIEGCNEPDEDNADGELAGQLDFLWWADDGDNILEEGEDVLPAGLLGEAGVGTTNTVTLADSLFNIWDEEGGPILTATDTDILYIGKAWCFGNIEPAPLPQDGNGVDGSSPADDNNDNDEAGEPEDGGFTCNGAEGVTNAAQTDVVRLDVGFRAVQARHNDEFLCVPQEPQEPEFGSLTVTKVVENGSSTNPLEVSDFPLFVDGLSITSGVATTTLTAGTYLVTETGTSTYSAVFSGDCDGEGNVTVTAGSSSSCTITNTFIDIQ